MADAVCVDEPYALGRNRVEWNIVRQPHALTQSGASPFEEPLRVRAMGAQGLA